MGGKCLLQRGLLSPVVCCTGLHPHLHVGLVLCSSGGGDLWAFTSGCAPIPFQNTVPRGGGKERSSPLGPAEVTSAVPFLEAFFLAGTPRMVQWNNILKKQEFKNTDAQMLGFTPGFLAIPAPRLVGKRARCCAALQSLARSL